jgi:hypothetical protein
MMDELLDGNLTEGSPTGRRVGQRGSGTALIPEAGHEGDAYDFQEASVFEEQRFDNPDVRGRGSLHESSRSSASASAPDVDGGPQMVLAPRDDLIVGADDILARAPPPPPPNPKRKTLPRAQAHTQPVRPLTSRRL